MAAHNEEWRDVPGYEGFYEVSSLGRVRSLTRRVRYKNSTKRYVGRCLRSSLIDSGYRTVSLCRDGKQTTFHVHRIVGLAFLGPKAAGFETDHLDGNKENNSATNLQYVSRSENAKRAYALGLRNSRGERHSQAKLTEDQVVGIRKLLRWGCEQAPIAACVGVSRGTISSIATGKSWGDCVPF